MGIPDSKERFGENKYSCVPAMIKKAPTTMAKVETARSNTCGSLGFKNDSENQFFCSKSIPIDTTTSIIKLQIPKYKKVGSEVTYGVSFSYANQRVCADATAGNSRVTKEASIYFMLYQYHWQIRPAQTKLSPIHRDL